MLELYSVDDAAPGLARWLDEGVRRSTRTSCVTDAGLVTSLSGGLSSPPFFFQTSVFIRAICGWFHFLTQSSTVVNNRLGTLAYLSFARAARDLPNESGLD